MAGTTIGDGSYDRNVVLVCIEPANHIISGYTGFVGGLNLYTTSTNTYNEYIVTMPFSGSLAAMCIRLSVNGGTTGTTTCAPQVLSNGSVTTYGGTIGGSGPTLSMSASVYDSQASYTAGQYTFSAGQQLQLYITASSNYNQSSPGGVQYTLWVYT